MIHFQCNECHELLPQPATAQLEKISALVAERGDVFGVTDAAIILAMARRSSASGDRVCRDLNFDGLATALLRVHERIEHFLFGNQRRCLGCETEKLLRELAAEAVSAATPDYGLEGAPYHGDRKLIDACEDLANYAGDDFPKPQATEAVLEHAACVFELAARVRHQHRIEDAAAS